jgi:hypothetical protein
MQGGECVRYGTRVRADLQAWLNDIQIQAVETLDGERDVTLDDIGN